MRARIRNDGELFTTLIVRIFKEIRDAYQRGVYPQKCMVVAIIGLPYAGKKTLAQILFESLRKKGLKTDLIHSDSFSTDFGPGFEPLFDFKEAQQSIQYLKQGGQIEISSHTIGPDLDVLIITDAYQIVKDWEIMKEVDLCIAIAFKDSKVRLNRKLEIECRPKEKGGQGRSPEEVINEFISEQFQGMDARFDVAEYADIIWEQDTKEMYSRILPRNIRKNGNFDNGGGS